MKLERGNANVRPPSERKKPFRDMVDTVEIPDTVSPKNSRYHVPLYLCEKFEFDSASRALRLTIPDIAPEDFAEMEDGIPKFGIADGGHTYGVIRQTMEHVNELKERVGDRSMPIRARALPCGIGNRGRRGRAVCRSAQHLIAGSRVHIKSTEKIRRVERCSSEYGV